MIKINEEQKIFDLSGKDFNYILAVNQFGYLENLYFGKKIEYTGFIKNFTEARGHGVCVSGERNRHADASQFMLEYSSVGAGDFRIPSIIVNQKSGARTCDLKYSSYKIVEKRFSSPLPKCRGGETLVISLTDESAGVTVDLYYTIYDDISAIVRSVNVKNMSNDEIYLDKAYSFNIDLPYDDYRITGLFGAHLKERSVESEKIMRGTHTLSSLRGVSSAQINPFIAVSDSYATENIGRVYGFNLIYSGNFELNVSLDEIDHLRINGGIASEDFGWFLKSGEEFETPECVIAYSDKGFNGMSAAFHDLYREHLINEKFVYASRPIVINNWEATYFNFDENKLKSIIDSVKGTGIDTFVLDDGWFGKRNDDTTSLGDWFANKEKLPDGLKSVSDYCHKNGLKFGLWFEPEMVSPESELYKHHPTWVVKIDGRSPCLGRDQLVLDLTNEKVVDFIVETISSHIENDGLDYIKWDMNRSITDQYSSTLLKENQKEFNHRYVLGLYSALKRITEKYPSVLIEGCASGGCRFDAGILAYCPQIWTSDNSDAYSRTRIQYGTSYCYPPSAMSCHVSVCPNHQTGRVTPFESRIAIASLGAFGFELDSTKLSDDERSAVKAACSSYRQDEVLLLGGDLIRLKSPFKDGYFAEMLVSKDKRRAKLTVMPPNSFGNDKFYFVRLYGLNENAMYRLNGQSVASGSALVHRGYYLPRVSGDYNTIVVYLEQTD